jgi:hydrogenase nickel incorporation protein HypA/HybF
MHELSIALSIIEGAEEEAARYSCKVVSLRIRIGRLSGVVKDALLFAYHLASEDTPLAGSQLLIEEVPVVVFCSQCASERTLASIQSLACPVCGTPTPEIVRGREMELVALELGPPEMKHEHNTTTAEIG